MYKIHENDELPQSICNGCSSKLTFFLEFQKTCESSEEKLLKAFVKQENLNTEIIENDDEPFSGDEFFSAKQEDADSNRSANKNDDHIDCTNFHVRPHFECDICQNIFKQKASIVRHMLVMHNRLSNAKQKHKTATKRAKKFNLEKPFKCDKCGKRFNKICNLKRHDVIHTGVLNYACEHCALKFKRSVDLKQHINNHHPELAARTKYRCDNCDLTFRSSTELKKHQATEHEDKQYHCLHCSVYFRHLSEFEKHAAHMHTDVWSKNLTSSMYRCSYSCADCGRLFDRRNNLKRHRIVHSEEYTFSCNVCSKQFKAAQNLKAHLELHVAVQTGEMYPCDICEKSFTMRRGLARHIRNVHTEENKCVFCDICDGAYSSKKKLAEHMISHSANRPWSCEECGKSFHQASQLRAHELNHQAESPQLECDICYKRFRRPHDLKRHIQLHIETPQFICTRCTRIYQSQSGLAKHLKKCVAAVDNEDVKDFKFPMKQLEVEIITEILYEDTKKSENLYFDEEYLE